MKVGFITLNKQIFVTQQAARYLDAVTCQDKLGWIDRTNAIPEKLSSSGFYQKLHPLKRVSPEFLLLRRIVSILFRRGLFLEYVPNKIKWTNIYFFSNCFHFLLIFFHARLLSKGGKGA